MELPTAMSTRTVNIGQGLDGQLDLRRAPLAVLLADRDGVPSRVTVASSCHHAAVAAAVAVAGGDALPVGRVRGSRIVGFRAAGCRVCTRAGRALSPSLEAFTVSAELLTGAAGQRDGTRPTRR